HAQAAALAAAWLGAWRLIQVVGSIQSLFGILCDDCFHHAAKVICQPMFPRNPPFSYSGVCEVVAHGSFHLVPERLLQRAVTIVNEHSLTISGVSGEERAEPEFVWCIKALEALHTLQKKHGKLAVFLGRSDQLAPLRGQDIDSGPSTLLVLLPNLNG